MNIPAISYMAIVRQYAIANKLPFFTWEEQKAAARLYDWDAKYKN